MNENLLTQIQKKIGTEMRLIITTDSFSGNMVVEVWKDFRRVRKIISRYDLPAALLDENFLFLIDNMIRTLNEEVKADE